MEANELEQLLAAAAEAAPREVVTHALSRDVTLPHGAGTCVLVTLDNGLDHRRPNTFGARGLAELDTALEAALSRDDVTAVAVTG
ncbi:MAG: 3-hydroxyacyl-CoA dehydrogenase NAD-binding protein, partial [Friedmanniella sp.]|nr:3-hydroxyacyl-CoA dehydrogenase NAD-binding protein [Friedmanniella sp.]